MRTGVEFPVAALGLRRDCRVGTGSNEVVEYVEENRQRENSRQGYVNLDIVQRDGVVGELVFERNVDGSVVRRGRPSVD